MFVFCSLLHTSQSLTPGIPAACTATLKLFIPAHFCSIEQPKSTNQTAISNSPQHTKESESSVCRERRSVYQLHFEILHHEKQQLTKYQRFSCCIFWLSGSIKLSLKTKVIVLRQVIRHFILLHSGTSLKMSEGWNSCSNGRMGKVNHGIATVY